MNKQTIKKPNEAKKIYKSLGMKIATLALALGINTAAISPDMAEAKEIKQLHIALAKDLPSDEFDKEIPIYEESGFKIIALIKENTVIISSAPLKEKKDDLQPISTIDSDNNIVEGFIERKHMDNIITTDVNSLSTIYSIESDKGLNYRNAPKVEEKTLKTTLPNKSILIGGKIDSKSKQKWTNVIYYSNNTLSQGFVSGNFIKEISPLNNYISKEKFSDISNKNHIISQKQKNSKLSKTTSTKLTHKNNTNNDSFSYTSTNNNVLGIDVSQMRPDYLEKLLTGNIKIEDTTKTIHGRAVNLKEFADKKINYVYIKLGASGYGSKHIKQIKGNDNYLKLAEICEKNKIPYGFYWYSTSYNVPEGNLEADWISEKIDNLENTKYHLLPTAIDVEVAPNDRQGKVPVEHVTMAKIALTNKLEEKYGKTILYTARNAVDDRYAERILDLAKYQEGLTKGASDIWFVNPINKKIHENSKQYIEKGNHNITTEQIALDVTLGSKYVDNILDFNRMDATNFETYLNGKYRDKIKAKPEKSITAESKKDDIER